MKVFLNIVFFLACLSPFHANAYTGVLDDVKVFYVDFFDMMTDEKFEEVIALSKKNFADDFAHLDDGEFAYDKEGLIRNLSKLQENYTTDQAAHYEIDIQSASYDEESRTAQVVFVSKVSSINSDNEKELIMSQRCLDTLDVLPENKTFQLKKCDCETLFKAQ